MERVHGRTVHHPGVRQLVAEPLRHRAPPHVPTRYGTGPIFLSDSYVYLPLLAFVQVPGLDYRSITIGAWLLTVWFVRKSGAAVALFAAPWVAILAASGFNDFVPLAALTATFVALAGWRSRVAEVVSLALKQFANVLVVVVHLWHRRWRDALLAVAVTGAILAPFAYLSPSGVWCHAILVTTYGPCTGSQGFTSPSSLLSHLNYYLWPTWILAVFGARYVAGLFAPDGAPVRAEAADAVARLRPPPSGEEVPPPFVVLAAPYVQVRAAVRALHPELWTIAKYCTVGGTGIVVNLLVFSAAREVLGPAALLALVASTVAFGVATVWNFTWNYLWTFQDRHSRPLLHHGVGFAGASLAALSVNLLVLYALQSSISALLAQFLGILSGTAIGFALNRWLNFSALRWVEAP